MNKLNEFLDTLKIHNKDISCFNDHLAVFKLKRLIEAEITSAVSEAVEEERKEKNQVIRWMLGLNSKIMRFGEFKGLRGYPLTHFQDKYTVKP